MSAQDKVLDGAGLAVVNQIIGDKLDKKQDKLAAGDGTTVAGNKVNVTTPVQGVFTQAEYDALPEAQKNKGLYIISDGSVGGISLQSLSIATPPDKTQYTIGETFDPTGMVAQAVFSGGDSVTIGNDSLTFSPDGPFQQTDTSVTVSLQIGGETASAAQEVSVSCFVWWSPKMTSNNTPSPYVASASSELSGHLAYMAFSGDLSDKRDVWHSDNQNGSWIQLYFGNPSYIRGLKIFPSESRTGDSWGACMPHKIALFCSEDGENFHKVSELTTDSGYNPSSGDPIVLELSKPALYSYYRIYFYDGYVSNYFVISEIMFLASA